MIDDVNDHYDYGDDDNENDDGSTRRHPHPRQVHATLIVILDYQYQYQYQYRWPHPQTPPLQKDAWSYIWLLFDFENIVRNPGTVEELHARWKEMLPQPFEGAKLLVQKGLSNNF